MSLVATISTGLKPEDVIQTLKVTLAELGADVRDDILPSNIIGFILFTHSEMLVRVHYSRFLDNAPTTEPFYAVSLETADGQELVVHHFHKVGAIHRLSDSLLLQTLVRDGRCSQLTIHRFGKLTFDESVRFRN